MDSGVAPAVWFPTIRAGSGSDVFTQRLATALNERGIRAEITWLPHRAEYLPWSVPPPKPPSWANVVHINSWLSARFIPPDLPVVATVHSCVHDAALTPYKRPPQRIYHRIWVRQLEKVALTRATMVTAVSEYTARVAASEFRLDPEKMVVIPNGIDTHVFSPPTEGRTAGAPFRVLYVGNWSLRKGSDLLAPIFECLGTEFELLYTADRHGNETSFTLPPNARCLGRLNGENELVSAYRQADALIFPSRLEGFGLVAAEAMACGLPVVSINTTAIPEVVEHGETGILCPADDIACLESALRQLANDPDLYQHLSHNARARAVRDFDHESTLAAFERLYRSCIN